MAYPAHVNNRAALMAPAPLLPCRPRDRPLLSARVPDRLANSCRRCQRVHFELALGSAGIQFGVGSRLRSGGGRHSSRIASGSRAELKDLPPSSREEAVQQAGASLRALLDRALRRGGPTTVKQRKNLRQSRLRVDIPVLDDSAGALLLLAQHLLASFLGSEKTNAAVVLYLPSSILRATATATATATNGAEPVGGGYLSLESGEGLPKHASAAFVVAPSGVHTDELQSIATSAGERPVVVVNPQWSEEEEQDGTRGGFLTSFSTAYSFVPLNIQGFFSKTEGAVLKHVRSGAPEGRPWLVYVKEGDGYKCVTTLKKRPTSADLENALYSSIAANSPVNKSIMFLRGLVSK